MDFDRPVQRRGTASFKWEMYPEGVLPLWVADMDFVSPRAVIDAVQARAEHGVFGYSRVPDSLVQAVRAHLAAAYGWSIEPSWLVWLPSVVPGLNLACRAYAGRGETIMTVTPAYPPFLEAPANQGRRLLTVPARRGEAGWQLPLAEMERAVTPKTRVLLFCHPHNPLGRAWTVAEVAEVVGFCRRHDLVLCSDEIHCDLVLDPVPHVPALTVSAEAARYTITLMSPSKTFNLPGLNFAFAVIPDEDLRRRFERAGAGVLPFPGCLALAAAEAAYRGGREWREGVLAYLRVNGELVERCVAESMPRVVTTHVEATYLAWLDVRSLGLADPARACLEAGVALSAGAAFGDPGFLRLNFACRRETLREALRRLRPVLA
jgi:cysteine-S-conjugate beta-lyase